MKKWKRSLLVFLCLAAMMVLAACGSANTNSAAADAEPDAGAPADSGQGQEAASQETGTTKRAIIVYGAPGTYLAALDSSLYGDILKTAGGVNVAADWLKLDKYPCYASLSAEKIVEANPEIVMLITHSDPEKVKEGFEKQMSENPAWKNVDVVKNDNIVILPAQLFDNPGSQIVEALDYMRDILEKAEGAGERGQ